MPRNDVVETRTLQDDLSRGVVGRVSPVGLKRGAPPNFVKSSSNWIFRPTRSATSRPGYRDASAASLGEIPTSIGKHYSDAGNNLYVATDDGASGGKIFRLTAASRTAQALPWSATNRRWKFTPANALTVGCQAGLLQSPIFYTSKAPYANAADTWLSMVLPKPASAPTFNADSGGGSKVTTKTYYYRVRWRYANGSSLASPVSAGRTVTSPNLTINLNVPVPASPRTDYVGWTLEVTKQNGSAAGPFYKLADGTATTYSDGAADSTLSYATDETIHGEPVPMDGTIFHKGRLFGWAGSSLFVSEPTIGEESTGIFNWKANRIYYVGKDDGDAIQSVILQGDRLLIGKRRSLWVLEGDDTDSFRLRLIYEGAGFAGPRAAAALGGATFFAAGDGRFFIARGDRVDPIGTSEVGDYLAQMDFGRDDEILAVNHLGDMVLFWYVARDKSYADDVLVYDLQEGNWFHLDSMPAVDALVQKDATDFSNATLLFADPRLLPPGNAGAAATNPSFVVWLDKRSASNWQIYVQKVSSAGVPQWTADGVQVSNSTGTSLDGTYGAYVVPDGSGGCIVLWNDTRNARISDVYGQRFNSSGVAQWTAGGISLETSTFAGGGVAGLRALVSDRNGGAIYVWMNSSSEAYIQRLDGSGAKLWGGGSRLDQNLVGFTPAHGFRVLANADGSCLVAWYGTTSGTAFPIKAQKVDASGAQQWAPTTTGLVIDANGTSDGYQTTGGKIALVSDDAGGMIMAWTRSNSVYVQRVNGSGAKQWATNGVLCNTAGTCLLPALVRDQASGCIVMWRELVSGTYSVMARRIGTAGTALWSPMVLGSIPSPFLMRSIAAVEDGFGGAVAVWDMSDSLGIRTRRIGADGVMPWAETAPTATSYATGSGGHLGARLVTDAASGGVVLWTDDRTSPGSAAARNVYAQRVGDDGVMDWTADGVVICTASAEQQLRSACFTDTPEGEYPPGLSSGYHVWCGLKGTKDKADVGGSGGDAIKTEIVGHLYDDGLPEFWKDYDLFTLIVNRGGGTFVATVEGDEGGVATIVLTTNSRAPRYDTGLLYDSGVKYASAGGEKITTGLPKGTDGKGATVRIAAALDEECEIGGWVLKGYVLPQEDHS